MSDLHVGDVGTRLSITIKEDGTPVDLSQATVKKLLLLKKNREVMEKELSFDDQDGANGLVYYKTIPGDITVKGDLTIQAYLELPEGKWHTDKVILTVDDNIIVPPTTP